MTHEEKINYMRIAANLCRFGFDNASLDLLVNLYELTLEKKGSTTIDDVVVIEHLVKEKYKKIKEEPTKTEQP
jgi:hypothetical protein